MKQAELNIGLFGHVDHGKTTLVKQITGKWTDTHSEELKRGISIRIGYATTTIRQCPKCGRYTTAEKCEKCGEKTEEKRRIAFVDSPGHESLMANAVAASNIIDGALFLVAANESFPQEQTKEHLEILRLVGIKHIVVVQTKLDLVSKQEALKQYGEMKEFFKKKLGFVPPIIPVSATYNLNIDKVMKAIVEHIPVPQRREGRFTAYVLRSFDVNKPGTPIEKLVGGVIGITIASGSIRKGEEITILPGSVEDGKPLTTKVVSLMEETIPLEEAKPGGLIALGTLLDPSLTKSDKLAGCVVVKANDKDSVKVYSSLEMAYELIEREDIENPPLRQNEPLLMNVNTATTSGVIVEIGKGKIKVVLRRPIALLGNERIAISRRIGNRWRLSAIGRVV